MPKVDYPGVSEERLARAAVQEVERVGVPGSRLFIGLSPFDIPTGATAEVQPGHVLEIRLEYPNSEPPESTERVAADDDRVTAILGRHTRKVLVIRVRDADLVLEHGNIPFDPRLAAAWASDLPPHEVSTCVRNAQLVCLVLSDMPPAFRRELVATMRDVPFTRVSTRQPRFQGAT